MTTRKSYAVMLAAAYGFSTHIPFFYPTNQNYRNALTKRANSSEGPELYGILAPAGMIERPCHIYFPGVPNPLSVFGQGHLLTPSSQKRSAKWRRTEDSTCQSNGLSDNKLPLRVAHDHGLGRRLRRQCALLHGRDLRFPLRLEASEWCHRFQESFC